MDIAGLDMTMIDTYIYSKYDTSPCVCGIHF